MESKVSLKDRLRRTSSAILSFGSQKQPIEKPDRYPYFRGPPSQRQSSICERQLISRPVERDLRNACYLLQRNIAHGVPSTDCNQNSEKQVVVNRAPSTRLLRPQSSALPAVLQAASRPRDSASASASAPAPASAPEQAAVSDKNDQKDVRPYKAHDYDADPWHRWSGIAIPTGPQVQVHSDNTSRIPSSSMKSTRDGASDMPFSSGETLVGGGGGSGGGTDSQQDRRAYVRVPANIQDDPESESNEEKDQQHNSAPYLDGSSRLVRKKRMENLHESSVRGNTTATNNTTSNDNNVSARNSASRPSAPRARYSWLPRTGIRIRPASTIETGSQRRAHDPVSPTIGTGTRTGTGSRTGIRRTAADEEQVRQNNLQQAVWEKMATGRISSRSKPTRPMSTTAMAMGLDDMSPKATTTTTTTTTATAAAAAATVTVDRRTASSPLTCRDMSHRHKSAFPVSVPVPEPGAGLPDRLPASKPETDTFQPAKRRSIMRKLAFLGFGKQKNNKETPAVGYSQIVEAA